MQLNLKREVFAIDGSFFSITDVTREVWGKRFDFEGLAIRTCRGAARTSLLAVPAFYEGARRVDYSYVAVPGLLTITTPGGKVEAAFDGRQVLRLRGAGVQMRLTLPAGSYDEIFGYPGGHWFVNSAPERTKLMVTSMAGGLEIEDPGLEARSQEKSFTTTGDAWELALEEFSWVWEENTYPTPFDQCVETVQQQFKAYFDAMPPVPAKYLDAAERAAFVNWSSTVGPKTLLKRKYMLMSKNWMNSVWSWDHAFNAVELASHHQEAAWDNLAEPFDRQHESGLLLDMVNDASIHHNYTKPPIHGWALRRMRRDGAVSGEQLKWIYPKLCLWTEYWFKYMDWDKDGLCQYTHGNDSGWDNCTYFLIGAPIEGPDLSAYLVLQMDELSEVAKLLDRPEEAAQWKARADQLLGKLIEVCWNGERFRVLQDGTHREQDGCDSLFAYLPVILGKRLPREIFDKLAEGLKQEGRFLTPFGLATESLKSSYYDPDGYWRGPIWAPPMMFIIDGLADGGETEFASELATRFCDNAAINGFAENYNAKNGGGLRDRAYTWTSSVFLMLAREYAR